MTIAAAASPDSMQIETVLAAVAVADTDRAEAFYTHLFGAGPDAHPMNGLTEWRFDGGTFQLVLDAERAGGSLVTLIVDALDGDTDTTSFGADFRVVEDPDGNAVTLVANT
jgi:catechol 2,3-dioxygenase-like lactoylglutathione lyase family enzyme